MSRQFSRGGERDGFSQPGAGRKEALVRTIFSSFRPLDFRPQHSISVRFVVFPSSRCLCTCRTASCVNTSRTNSFSVHSQFMLGRFFISALPSFSRSHDLEHHVTRQERGAEAAEGRRGELEWKWLFQGEQTRYKTQ